MLKTDFELVVRQHQSMVYSIAYHFFHNSAVAEEVAQDVFLRLFQSRENISAGGAVVVWLRRTAANRCIDVLRKASTRREVQMDPLPDVAADGSERDPLLQERVRRLVASLPETPRAVVVLRYGEDMDPQEIGRVLGMPVSTVRSHLHRATALLREKAAAVLEGSGR